MSNWQGEHATGRPAGAKIPVKVHRNVSIIWTSEPFLAEEILARPKLSRLLTGRMTANVLLIQPDKASEVAGELRKMGHTPQVVGTR